jgi:hypothetical protein
MSVAGMQDVKAEWESAIAAAGAALLRHAIVAVPCDSPGWVDTGVDVRAGETVTLLSAGAVELPRDPPMRLANRIFLWRRIGGRGPIAKFTASTTTFDVGQAGRLELVTQFPGAWLDENGTLAPEWPREAARGVLIVAILIWKVPVADGLAWFAAKDASGVGLEERDRLAVGIRPPRGWAPLWRVGATEIFCEQTGPAEAPSISCRCAGDAGILKYPVDFPLDSSTRLLWRWRVIKLPSKVAENDGASHDYLSIAVEFDNGLDLTYMWSAALPVGTSFRCPLPWWDKHETHQVVRSGDFETGQWRAEKQPLLADYAKAIGGAPPARIVGVWLIAVSAFQGRRGECEYSAIELTDANASVAIEP